jgi:hypothetical protein
LAIANIFPRVILQDISYYLDIADYEYDKKISLSPTVVKADGMKLKN